MGSAYRRDVIENWVSDFVMSDGMRGVFGWGAGGGGGGVGGIFGGGVRGGGMWSRLDIEEGDLKGRCWSVWRG